ncbi:MAG: MarR family transcriptional regulator [Pseudomonadota bacterium]
MDSSPDKDALSLDEKVMIGMVRASEMFKKNSSAIFKKYGLTFAQYNVLRALNSSPNGYSTVTNVGKIMLVTGANMTGLAKRMERDGFLQSRRHEHDERVKLLEITEKGRQTLKNIEVEKEAHVKSYIGDMPEDEKKKMLVLVKRMITTASGS